MALDLTKINLYLEKEKSITPEEISSFKIDVLKKPETYQKFLITIANHQYEYEAKITLPFIDSLEKLLEKIAKTFPEEPVLEKYREIIRYLQFFHLYFQKHQIIKDLFENYFLFALKSGIDIKGQLHKLFVFYNYDMSGWTEIRDLILKSLRENKEKLGQEKIKMKEIEIIPLVKNWFLDYEPFRKEGRAIDRASYMAKSENFRKLKEEDRKILMQILEIYDYLQFDLNWFMAAAENRFIFLPPERIPIKRIPRPPLTTLEKRPKIKPSEKPAEPKSALEKKYIDEEKG